MIERVYSEGYLSIQDYINIFFNFDKNLKVSIKLSEEKYIVYIQRENDLSIPHVGDTLESAFESAFQMVMYIYGAPEVEKVCATEFFSGGFWREFVKKYPKYVFDSPDTDDDELYYWHIEDSESNRPTNAEIIDIVKQIGEKVSQAIDSTRHIHGEQYTIKFGNNTESVEIFELPKGVNYTLENVDECGVLLLYVNGAMAYV